MRSVLGLHLLANRFPALHGLRALAVLAIVQLHVSVAFGHLQLISTGPHSFYQRSTGVWFVMDLFFLLSGFLIGYMLLGEEGISPKQALRFWLRRAFRIVPPYYVVLTLLATFGSITPSQRAFLWHEYAYLTNYFPTDGPPTMVWSWSLCVEEHFYLVVPLLVLALDRLRTVRQKLFLLGALCASGLLLRVGFIVLFASNRSYPELFTHVYPRTHMRYDVLLAGVLMAVLQRNYASQLEALCKRTSVRALLLTVSATAFALLWHDQWGPMPLRVALEWSSLTTVLWGPIILLLCNSDTAIGRFLSARFFLYLATLGYGIYLVHPIVGSRWVLPVMAQWVLSLVREGKTPPSIPALWVLAFVLTTVVSALLSYALHLFVEKPALRLRDRLVPGR